MSSSDTSRKGLELLKGLINKLEAKASASQPAASATSAPSAPTKYVTLSKDASCPEETQEASAELAVEAQKLGKYHSPVMTLKISDDGKTARVCLPKAAYRAAEKALRGKKNLAVASEDVLNHLLKQVVEEEKRCSTLAADEAGKDAACEELNGQYHSKKFVAAYKAIEQEEEKKSQEERALRSSTKAVSRQIRKEDRRARRRARRRRFAKFQVDDISGSSSDSDSSDSDADDAAQQVIMF